MVILVNRIGPTTAAASAMFSTANGTALAGIDYTAETGALSWAAGDSSVRYITLFIAPGSSGNRAFTVALADPVGASLGTPTSATVTITPASATPAAQLTLSAAAFSVAPAAGQVAILVNRIGPTTAAASAMFATANGTALAGTDYTAETGALNWAAGDSSVRYITLFVAPGGAGNKTFDVALYDLGGASVGPNPSAIVSISAGIVTTPNDQLALAASNYSVAPSGGSLLVSVNRIGTAGAAASVNYATANGTALANTDYTAASGTLNWAAGSSSPQSISIPIAATGTGNTSFSISLSSPGGATLGSNARATVSIAPSGAPPPLAIHVSGNGLTDASGQTVQLRGVNVSGLEGVAIQGWDPSNPWGGVTGTPTPNWTTIRGWGANAVRLPLNEASWLGLTCIDEGGYGVHYVNGVKTPNAAGSSVLADPGGNYRATVAASVANATAAGLYVIVDLHLAAPAATCPTMQNAMADADHSIAFWSSVAGAFKAYPNVIFELFNEPFLDQVTLTNNTPWPDLLNGGTLGSYRAQSPSSPWYVTINAAWQTAGMQQMLDAVRATGATNVVLTSTLAYTSTMGGWLQYHPKDSLSPSQIGAAWHAYPAGSSYPAQVDCIGGLPACSAQTMAAAQAIMAAGYPVVITEFGDPAGGSGAPLSSKLLPFADTNGISYLAWAWDIWPGTEFYLITDAAGTPTGGFGVYVKAHYLCRAAGTANCP
jgi:hypothetical protein